MTECTAIWLYGSHARGSEDCFSDVDVLFIGETNKFEANKIIENNTKIIKPSLSVYSWHQIDSMWKYGSLFLKHIHLEGRPLYESPKAIGKLSTKLSSLPKYKRALQDTRSFQKSITDVRWGLSVGTPYDFEAAALATVIRHAAILYCCILDKPNFERYASVRIVATDLDLPKTYVEAYERCYEFKLISENRKSKEDEPCYNDLVKALSFADKLIEELEVLVCSRIA